MTTDRKWIWRWNFLLHLCTLKETYLNISVEKLNIFGKNTSTAVADPGGGAAGARPPYGSRFFRFDIQIFRNVAASGVGAPPRGRRSPLREILDPLLHSMNISLQLTNSSDTQDTQHTTFSAQSTLKGKCSVSYKL